MKLGNFQFDPVASASGLCLLLVACSSIAGLRAQGYMNDGSSIYVDSWEDSSYMYGYGSTAGSLSFHQYSVDVSITSPLGRTSNATSGTYRSGTVAATATLSWSYDTVGHKEEFQLQTINKLLHGGQWADLRRHKRVVPGRDVQQVRRPNERPGPLILLSE